MKINSVGIIYYWVPKMFEVLANPRLGNPILNPGHTYYDGIIGQFETEAEAVEYGIEAVVKGEKP